MKGRNRERERQRENQTQERDWYRGNYLQTLLPSSGESQQNQYALAPEHKCSCPPRIHMLDSLSSKGMVFGGGAFGWCFSHKGGVLANRTPVL